MFWLSVSVRQPPKTYMDNQIPNLTSGNHTLIRISGMKLIQDKWTITFDRSKLVSCACYLTVSHIGSTYPQYQQDLLVISDYILCCYTVCCTWGLMLCAAEVLHKHLTDLGFKIPMVALGLYLASSIQVHYSIFRKHDPSRLIFGLLHSSYSEQTITANSIPFLCRWLSAIAISRITRLASCSVRCPRFSIVSNRLPPAIFSKIR
jgi:hypothetical protein